MFIETDSKRLLHERRKAPALKKKRFAMGWTCILICLIPLTLQYFRAFGAARRRSSSMVQKHTMGGGMDVLPTSAPGMLNGFDEEGCTPWIKVFPVGGCPRPPILTLNRACPSSRASRKSDYTSLVHTLAAEHKEKGLFREIVSASGQVIHAGDEIPAEVQALFDVELFVFPTCETGTMYSTQSPSAGRNFNVTVMSTSPRVLMADDFLTPSECELIIGRAKETIGPSTVSAEGAVPKNYQESSRTSSTAWLPPDKSSIAGKLRQRVGELIGIDFSKHAHVITEDLQVLRYQHGEHYHTHHDFFDPVKHKGFTEPDGRNRFITVLFYLTDLEEGGETMFPTAGDDRPITSWADCTHGLKIAPKRGRVVIFYSLTPEGQQTGGVDQSSWHAGCDVGKGIKWAANYWISLKGVHKK